MQIIKEQKIGEYYSSAVDIGKDEWLEILKDETVSEKYKEAVICFYYMPDYKGSCVAVGNRLGKNAYSLVATIMNFGKYVQKRLGRFQVVDEDGNNTYWPIPMKQGKTLSDKEEGNFEWTLRPELVDAIREYLYWYLIERYKELRKEIPIRHEKFDELYKWELITSAIEKTPIGIVSDGITYSKSNKGGFENLYDAIHDRKTLKYLVDNKKQEFEQILSNLVDEKQPIHGRISGYKSSLSSLLPKDGYSSKANDERTAATILTCYNPDNYTYYKYEGMYDNFCKYLGEEKKPTGRCYEHYLDLIRKLAQMAVDDQELQKLVSPMLEGLRKSDLLLAQDMVWMLVNWMHNRLGFVSAIVWPVRYWCVGYNYGGHESQLQRFLNENIWEGRFDPVNDKKLLQTARLIEPNDILILKSSFTKGEGHKQPCIRISALGKVHRLEESDEDGFRKVTCHTSYFNSDSKDFDGSKFGKYRKTIDKCSDSEIIEYIISIIDTEHMENNYQSYIDLLKSNHNLILTGAPGTGKTYLAKQIAKKMIFGEVKDQLTEEEQTQLNEQCGFVQFHPSYDYTDFVEGLRPIESGNGFNCRNGIFKEFCADALQNLIDSKKTLQALKQETSVRGVLDDFLEESIEQESTYYTSGTKNEFHIVENKERSIIIEVPANEKVKTLALPKSDLITLMENEVEITGGKDIQQYFHRKYRTQQDSYTYVLYGLLRKQKAKKSEVVVSLIPEKKFVFIIDEINRGEISKIFGELFFSIDPGYRGEKGMVQTQYQNMIEEDDIFKKGFYVPENVYIIGTMNDIDRSVESMDFAMRRRFAWKEMTAEESYEAMKGKMTDPEKVRQRMLALNDEIAKTPGLNKSYQIGAAYFLKLDEYGGDFDKLWEYHLKGLLYEYLRGNRDVDEQLKKLENAYKGISESAGE